MNPAAIIIIASIAAVMYLIGFALCKIAKEADLSMDVLTDDYTPFPTEDTDVHL